MSGQIIPKVDNNRDKQQTYRKMTGKYSRAIKNGFYYEAIMIAYAMMEDRMTSMLYHMGILADRNAKSVVKKKKPFLESCVDHYKGDKEDTRLGIKKLESKIKIIKCVYLWASNTEGGYEADKFASMLKSKIEKTDIDEVLAALIDVEKWKAYRNEMVHAMMNKSLLSLESILEPIATEGMRLARVFDAQVRRIKKRKSVGK